MADLVKDLTETVFDNYTTTLGESQDKVVVGNEKVVFAELSVDDKVVEYIEPTIRFTKWSEEESLTISYPTPTGMTDKTLIDGEGLKLYGGAEDFYFNQYDDNTFKFGLILNEIPDKSKIVTIDGVEYYQWQFKLEGWENFDFFYQPELTQKDIDSGCHRSDHVVGSYEIFHKTKKNHIIGQTNYGTGKCFHWYRSRFLDSKGNLTWGILDIKDGVVTKNCPQDFLDKATYPVRSNATLGYTTVGGSSQTVGPDYIYTMAIGSAGADAGVVTKIAIATGYGARTCRFGLYDRSGAVASIIRDWTAEGTANAGACAFQVWDSTQSYSLVNGTGYFVAYWGDTGATDIAFTSTTYDAGGYRVYTYDGSTNWESPYTRDESWGTDRQFSVYVTYVAGGAVPIYTKEILASLPATAVNLSTEFTEQEYTDVLIDDGNYVDLTNASGEYCIFLFKDYHGAPAGGTVTWIGQSSTDCSVSTAYLQIYNETTDTWITIDFDNTTAKHTDFTLTGTFPTSGYTADDFFTSGNHVNCRVYQLL